MASVEKINVEKAKEKASIMKDIAIRMETKMRKATSIMDEVEKIWDSPKSRDKRKQYDEVALIFPKAKTFVDNLGQKIEDSAKNFEINE